MFTPKLPKQLFGRLLPNSLSRSVLVFSQHLDGLLHSPVPDILQPGIDHGVRYVSDLQHRCKQQHHHLPRNAIHTPRRIPLISSRTASLRPLPSCRYFALHIQPGAEAV